jgi:hypothetical protein
MDLDYKKYVMIHTKYLGITSFLVIAVASVNAHADVSTFNWNIEAEQQGGDVVLYLSACQYYGQKVPDGFCGATLKRVEGDKEVELDPDCLSWGSHAHAMTCDSVFSYQNPTLTVFEPVVDMCVPPGEYSYTVSFPEDQMDHMGSSTAINVELLDECQEATSAGCSIADASGKGLAFIMFLIVIAASLLVRQRAGRRSKS